MQKSRNKFPATHRMGHTRAYAAWSGMKQRCSNPKNPSYQHYGAKGIHVCERWVNSFENFFSDMGHPPDGMTLDRKDNGQGYSPENCQWATMADQNRTRTYCRMVELNGKRQTISEWARDIGVPVATLFARLYRGWSAERALAKGGAR